MKRLTLLLSALLLVFACDKADKARVDELQQSLDELQHQALPGVPDADGIVPDGQSVFAFSFDRCRYGIDAGGSVTINYTLPEAATIYVTGKEGWGITVPAGCASHGQIVVTAPDPASPADFIVTATTPDGRSTAAMLPLLVRDPYSEATRPVFKAMGYRGPKNHMATLETFQKLADAGINIITVETDEGPFMHQLDLAEQVGMKCVPVVWPYAEAYDRDPENYKGLDEIINQLKDHPATFAYHIYDEPSTVLIPSLKLRKEKIESLDPIHPVYINLNPEGSQEGLGTATYYDYIESFIRDCGVKFLSYDMYPCRPEGDPTYPDGIVCYWWKCNEIVSRLTKQYGIPWWGFAASCWIDNEEHLFAKPTLENLRLQVYTNLAFGAQVIQYFVILQYGGTSYAPLLLDGTWTEAYDTLKDFNTELHRRGWVFDGCESDKVRHTNLIPYWSELLREADLPPEISGLVTDQDALIGFITNRGNKYLTVANKSLKDKMSVDAVFTDMVYTIARDGVFCEQQPGPAHFLLDEGDMLVIKYR
ncbi:MAG: hypothetical protein IKX71_02850 [Bacteroidales bacterium]|nr:hypothetical protein [Bacteroidales bacterium]